MILDVALKEWAIVTELLLAGRMALLLRKGGIYEDDGPGRFRVEHERFLLWPAYEHERLDWIKPGWVGGGTRRSSPGVAAAGLGGGGEVELRGWGEAVRVWEVPSREAFDRLEALHPWAKPQIDMRFDYKPDRPLYLMAVRAYRLPEVKRVENRPSYAGCRSWVPLEEADAVAVDRDRPAMGEAEFGAVLARVEGAFA